MPWSGDAPPFGFSSNPSPWLPQPPTWAAKTAEAQEREPASVLTLYRNALRIRRSREDMRAGELQWLGRMPRCWRSPKVLDSRAW